VVTLINPAGPGIGDPVGMERMFTATCDQPRQREFTSTATRDIRSEPGVREARSGLNGLLSSSGRRPGIDEAGERTPVLPQPTGTITV